MYFILMPSGNLDCRSGLSPHRFHKLVRSVYCPRRPKTRNCPWSKNMLIAAFILVISSAATVQFIIFSWRAELLRTVSEPHLGEEGASLEPCPNLLSSSSFQEVATIYRELCPDLGGPTRNLRAVSLYYAAMRQLGRLASAIVPAAGAGWAEREMALCTQYATVMLSQRLERNMVLVQEARSL